MKKKNNIFNIIMYKLISITKSDRKGKKWMAKFLNKKNKRTKTTHFGATGYEDYTQHKDKERRRLYRERHEKDLDTKDPTKAGYLSYYVLWGDSTNMDENIRNFKKKFNL